MTQENFYEESGNVIMKGTKEYERTLKEHKSKKNNSSNIESELRGLKKSQLIKKFHEMVDPDKTEDVSDETKDEIIERITNFIKNFSGGRRNKKTRKAKKTRKSKRTQ